jgi:hypothetical protein
MSVSKDNFIQKNSLCITAGVSECTALFPDLKSSCELNTSVLQAYGIRIKV